jgi:hypothetical protein
VDAFNAAGRKADAAVVQVQAVLRFEDRADRPFAVVQTGVLHVLSVPAQAADQAGLLSAAALRAVRDVPLEVPAADLGAHFAAVPKAVKAVHSEVPAVPALAVPPFAAVRRAARRAPLEAPAADQAGPRHAAVADLAAVQGVLLEDPRVLADAPVAVLPAAEKAPVPLAVAADFRVF